jgi:hypothetical protein
MTFKMPLLFAALVAAATGAVADARACGYFDYRQVRPAVHVQPKPAPIPASERIAAADQRLEEEHLTEAGLRVVTAFPHIRSISVGASPLETRALRILSLAVVRAGGAIPGAAGFSATREAERGANLEWAASALRSINAARSNDPLAQADLAEALASQPQHEDESLALLADLASRDLLGSAHAYATLARLQASRGDTTASRTALDRCELMTRTPASVCRVPNARLAIRG